MEFVILNQEEYLDNLKKFSTYSFYQHPNWGKLKEENGWKTHLLGVKKAGNIIAMTMVLSKKVFLNYSIFYAPRGYLMDFKDKKTLAFFTKNLKIYLKKHRGIFLKIDPYLIYKERDIDGNIIKDGINNEEVVNFLIDLGYRHLGFNKLYENMQPRWAFVLDVEGKTKEEILKKMEGATRRRINKAIKLPITVESISKDELGCFKDIMNHTAKRRGFIDRPIGYYENMMDILGELVSIYVVRLDVEKYLKTTSIELEEIEKDISEANKLMKEGKKNPLRVEKQLKELNIQRIAKIKILEKYEKILKEKGKVLNLGAGLFMENDYEILSLFGGAYDEYQDLGGVPFLNWKMIERAIEENKQRYNFYGITGVFDKTHEMHGLYEFKRNFGGHVEEYIGEFDLIVNKFLYLAYKLAFKVYKSLKAIIR